MSFKRCLVDFGLYIVIFFGRFAIMYASLKISNLRFCPIKARIHYSNIIVKKGMLFLSKRLQYTYNVQLHLENRRTRRKQHSGLPPHKSFRQLSHGTPLYPYQQRSRISMMLIVLVCASYRCGNNINPASSRKVCKRF